MIKTEHGCSPRTYLVRVFIDPTQRGGGNPAPIVVHADSMNADEMRAVAAAHGHESGFVVQTADPDCQIGLRYFVPNHEMEMCGHATVGALWVLRETGLWDGSPVQIQTLSGKVKARQTNGRIEISQPAAQVRLLDDDQTRLVAQALGIPAASISGPVMNASTSRVKTLVPMPSLDMLRGLRPQFDMIEPVCEAIGSTGLYPYAVVDQPAKVYEARQFPKSSGYPEDAATGIAATALSYGLRQMGLVSDEDSRLRIRQGVSMGFPSEIHVRLPRVSTTEAECWLSGEVCFETGAAQGKGGDGTC